MRLEYELDVFADGQRLNRATGAGAPRGAGSNVFHGREKRARIRIYDTEKMALYKRYANDHRRTAANGRDEGLLIGRVRLDDARGPNAKRKNPGAEAAR